MNVQTHNRPEKILDVQNVTVSFDGFKALDGLDFSIQKGELRFVIGPNGAGKTTLLDVATGKTRPASGKVIFNGGVDVAHEMEHTLVRKGLSRKFQTPSVFGSLSVYENLEATVGFNDPTLSLLRGLTREEEALIHDTLALIGLMDRMQVKAGILAHGEKQWLEIGMLLVQKPSLLLLDEPVAGMTRQERNRTGELLQSIAHRCSVVVVEHDMEFVRNFAKTVTVLHLGQMLCEGAVEDVQRDERVVKVYLGRAHA
ncbi:MAG: urea ABC transporter ATP-binding protein UrtD [Chloroflexi bacterium]|nr:urea ABC transporter ATP-binding protein UrtD [Chloroflexota bacterium]